MPFTEASEWAALPYSRLAHRPFGAHGGKVVLDQRRISDSQTLELFFDLIQLFVRHLVERDEAGSSALDPAKQFIELQAHNARLPVLRVLNKKDDQKRDDRGSRVDDELPRIRIVKQRAGRAPGDDDRRSKDKGPRRPDQKSGVLCDTPEKLVYLAPVAPVPSLI